MKTKICSKCRKELPIDQFTKRTASPDGLSYWCKECTKKVDALCREKNRKKIAVRKAKWYKKNKEKILAHQTAYSKVNKEKVAACYAAWYQRNRDTVISRTNAYQREHKEEIAPMRAAYAAKRRALKKNVTVEEDLLAIKDLYELAKNGKKIRCYLCGKLIPKGHRHVDHIIPISKGGNHSKINLAITHSQCNLEKNAKLPEELGLLL